jgi:hypothetical protein
MAPIARICGQLTEALQYLRQIQARGWGNAQCHWEE